MASATVNAVRMTSVLQRRVGEKGRALARAYDEDYRNQAPIGRAGAVPNGQRRSIRLNDALRTRVTHPGALRVEVHVEVDDVKAPHGKFIDQPTDLIVPRRAKALRWFGYRTGKPIFAMKVVPSRAHEGWWGRWTDRLSRITTESWERQGGF